DADRQPALAGAEGSVSRHPRSLAAPARSPAGLRVPSALPPHLRSVPHRASVAPRGPARRLGRLSPVMSAGLLEARRVTRIFGGGLFDRSSTLALDDFSLAIDSDRPSILAVVGESGSGKTTLGRLLLGLTAPTRGQVLYRGRDLQTMSRAEWRTF